MHRRVDNVRAVLVPFSSLQWQMDLMCMQKLLTASVRNIVEHIVKCAPPGPCGLMRPPFLNWSGDDSWLWHTSMWRPSNRCLIWWQSFCPAGLCQQLAVAWRQIVADNERLRLQLLLHGAALPPHGGALPAPWPQFPEVDSAVILRNGAPPASRAALTMPATLPACPPESAADPAACIVNMLQHKLILDSRVPSILV